MKRFYIPILFFMSFASNAQHFESADKHVPLIELFTSEGCSSCPPADRWLSSLGEEKELWSGFVPIAFHIDYWDYIGWKDPFASKEYSQRQRRYAAEFQERTVYTPGVRKSGEEWRSWRFFGDPEDTSKPEIGKISITVADDHSFSAQFVGKEHVAPEGLQLNVAVLGIDLSTQVTRGENRGKTLDHDFVVLGVSRYSSAQLGKWQGTLPEPSTEAPRYAVAAWITKGGSQTPLQATGGYLAQR